MEIYAYQLSQDVEDFFNASKLVQVSMAYKSRTTGKWTHHRNKIPATSLFNRVTVFPLSATEFHLYRYNKPYALVESTDQGASWRHYNRPTKEESTIVRIFVEGDPGVDLFHVNPGVRIEQQIIGDGKETKTLSTVHNISLVNGAPWQDVRPNVDIDSIGCMWFMRGIKGGTYAQGGYIANGNTIDLNRGSGRVAFCKLTDDPAIPLATDVKGNSDLELFNTDYIYSEEDQLDADREYLYLSLYYGVKKTISPLVIPITTIL